MTEEKNKYIKQWLEKAEEDLQVYNLIMNDEEPFLASAGFHLQQSAEKFLKAFLEYNKVFFVRTHDIEYLLKECILTNDSFSEIQFEKISDYAVDIRYPGDMVLPSKSELELNYEQVLIIRQLVLSLIIL